MVGDRSRLSAGWALRHLLERALLTPAELVGEGADAEDRSMSHAAFRIRVGARDRWFLKRADLRRSLGRDLGSEAAVYRLAAADPVLASVMPRCDFASVDGQLILLEAVAGEPVMAFDPPAARACGIALGRVHRSACPPFGTPPWLLDALEPGWGNYSWLPAPCAALLGRLHRHGAVRRGFALARQQWCDGALVHGDVRGTNLLLDSERQQAWLVDWELACRGDPAWDLGSLLADILVGCLFADSEAGLDDDAWQLARDALTGYGEESRTDEHARQALLVRSTRLCGVRMVQVLLEMGYQGAEQLRHGEALLAPWIGQLLSHAPMLAATVLASRPRAADPAPRERAP